MYCSNCGTKNDATSRFCQSCGEALAEPSAERGETEAAALERRPHVPNYLVQSILVTIFCCLPAGIVSIIYAAQVNGKLAGGDYEGARRVSQSAKTWAWVSFGVGIVVVAISLFAAIIPQVVQFTG